MKSFKQFDKVLDFAIKHRLSEDIIIYCENEQDFKDKTSWLFGISPSGITSVVFDRNDKRTDGTVLVQYGGFKIWYVNIEQL